MDDMRTYPDPIIAGLAYDLEIVTEPDGQVVRVELTPVIDGANTLDDYGVTVEYPTVPVRGEAAHSWVLDHVVPGMVATARGHLASLKPVVEAAWLSPGVAAPDEAYEARLTEFLTDMLHRRYDLTRHDPDDEADPEAWLSAIVDNAVVHFHAGPLPRITDTEEFPS